MTNCLVPSTHQSLDPLCILFSTPQTSVGNTIQNNSHEETPTNATLSRSHHVATTPLEKVIQFGVPMVEHSSIGIFKGQPIQQNHLLCYGLCKQCFLMFDIHKVRGTNYCPLLLRQLYIKTIPNALKKNLGFV